MPLELIVDKSARMIQTRSLFDLLLKDGLTHGQFAKYKNYFVSKKESDGSGEHITLTQYLQYLLDDKTLSFYTKSRSVDGSHGDVFYPRVKDYITRFNWSVVKMNSEQLFWAQHGE